MERNDYIPKIRGEDYLNMVEDYFKKVNQFLINSSKRILKGGNYGRNLF